MALRIRLDQPWSPPFSTITDTTIPRKSGAINGGISPLSLNLPPTTLPYPPPTMATATIHHGYGNGTTHPATHQSTVFSPSMTLLSLQTPHKKTPHPNTTMPRPQRRTPGSAHRHSLCCQGRRNRSALANYPRFAPRQQKHRIKWLLKQTQIFLPDISMTMGKFRTGRRK